MIDSRTARHNARSVAISVALIVCYTIVPDSACAQSRVAPAAMAPRVVNAAAFDVSPPLAALQPAGTAAERVACARIETSCGLAPSLTDVDRAAVRAAARPAAGASAAIEQTAQGARPPLVLLESFDGHGFGMVGPHGPGGGNNPSDNSLAVGPNHIMETVNSRIAVYTKRGGAVRAERHGAVRPAQHERDLHRLRRRVRARAERRHGAARARNCRADGTRRPRIH